MEVGLYGVNPTIPYRRLLVRSPLPTISLTSASQPRALISPSCNFPAPSKIVIASGDASSIRMRELSKATASSPVDVIHSLLDQRSPSLRQTKLIILACSMPEFDFVDFDRNLKSSSPTRAQESSLCAKVASSLCLCLYWPNQTSLSPICSCVCNIRQVNCCKESHCQNPIIHSSQKWIIPSIISDRESGECSPFFFARDPSFEKNDFVVSLLQSANPRGWRHGGQKLSWLPLGFQAIERREELHFPDGRKYRLTSTICRNPHYTIKYDKSTQTDSSKCDVVRQVSTIQTFTLGDKFTSISAIFHHWIYWMWLHCEFWKSLEL